MSRKKLENPIRKPTNISDPVLDYCNRVLSKEIVAGPLVRLACKRHLSDLETGSKRGLFYDHKAAEHVFGFFEDILMVVDRDEGPVPFKLQPWQKFIIGSLFGWKRADGNRRFRMAYVEIAKGNGKSPLVAGIALFMLTADKEYAAECYAAAVNRDQANIMFRDAVMMVDASEELSEIIRKSGAANVHNLAYVPMSSYYRPVSSEGRGLDGKRVHFAGIDEVHEHKSSTVVDKMRAGTKGRKQPLIMEITNSGVDKQSICFLHHEYSRKLLNGFNDDDEWFAYVCGMDEDDDPMNDASCWIKANPNLGVSIFNDYISGQVREAKGMPAKESIVRRLNFCEWVDADNPWVSSDIWLPAQKDDLYDYDFEGEECYGGLDLSGVRDLTAFVLAFERKQEVFVFPWFWTPEDTLAEHQRRDGAPYKLWVEQGYLETTPGQSIDYAFVAEKISQLAARFKIQKIAFDPYRIKYFERDMQNVGLEVPLQPHGQGYRKAGNGDLWMPRSIDLFETRLFKKKIWFKKNPVMTWNAASAQTASDEKGNRIFAKRKATGRIDGVVSAAMAVGAIDGGERIEKSFWES